MIKIQHLQLDLDKDNVITLSLKGTKAEDIGIIATTLTKDAAIDLKMNAWQNVHPNFDMFLNTENSMLQFREKDVPEGPRGKGNILSTIPASFIRLGIISEEEYYQFNNAIRHHPIIEKRLEKTIAYNRQLQEKVMKDFEASMAKFKK